MTFIGSFIVFIILRKLPSVYCINMITFKSMFIHLLKTDECDVLPEMRALMGHNTVSITGPYPVYFLLLNLATPVNSDHTACLYLI